MINAAELIDNLVAFLRDIPDLVAEMEGNPERIFAYHHRYPKQRSLDEAKHGMPAPGIMVAHLGPRPGSLGGVTMWHHRVSLYLRTRETFEGDPPGGLLPALAADFRRHRNIAPATTAVRGDPPGVRAGRSARIRLSKRCRGSGLL